MLKTAFLIACIEFVRSENMEPFIVGGKEIDIALYSHTAFIAMETCKEMCCKWLAACGASILNQNIVISAAHCFRKFDRHSKVIIRAGYSNNMVGSVRHVTRMVVHRKYDKFTIENDIALAYFKKPFQLGSHVKRVIVMKELPNTNEGYVAGWRFKNEITKPETILLYCLEQRLWSRDECMKLKVPPGFLCAGTKDSSEHPTIGDGGFALVVNGSIQVGLVSFRAPNISKSIIMYTDVSYFYQWIMNAAKNLYCY